MSPANRQRLIRVFWPILEKHQRDDEPPVALPEDRRRYLRLRLWAPIWAFWHWKSYRGYLNIGLPDAFSALLVSRVVTVEQARRLGWSVETLRRWSLQWIWRSGMDYTGRRNRVNPGDVEQLIRWAQARPDDGQWYISVASRLTEVAELTDAALPYLTSSQPQISLDQVLLLARSSMPYAIFEMLYQELKLIPAGWDRERELFDDNSGAELYYRELVQPLCALAENLMSAVHAGHLDWWEVPGWVIFDRPTGAVTLLHRKKSIGAELRARMISWHRVNLAVGAAGPHAAFWWKAGFSVEEAVEQLATGTAPTAETLATMAALRGDGWRL